MDFWFSLKKLLSIYINPVSVTLELVFLGIVLISFASRKTRRTVGPKWGRFKAFLGDFGVFLVTMGMIVLFLCSIDPVAGFLTLHLESRHPPLAENEGTPVLAESPEYIVVLAGGHRAAVGKPELSQLSRFGFARVVGGVDLWRKIPTATFVVTGHPKETSAMRAVAVRLGVPPESILEESESRDTKDHPVYLKPILGNSPFLLVTSGIHMPRAMGLFQAQGLDPVAASVDLQVWPFRTETDPYRQGLLIPRVENLQLTSAALHEIGGLAWSGWRGEITTPSQSKPEASETIDRATSEQKDSPLSPGN